MPSVVTAGDAALNKAFDVALHLGTLVGACWYFRRDLARYLASAARSGDRFVEGLAFDALHDLRERLLPIVSLTGLLGQSSPGGEAEQAGFVVVAQVGRERFGILVDEVFRIIESLKARGVTMLLVEQFAAAALKVADYGYVLEVGRIVLEDSCAALMEKDDIKEFYLGIKQESARGQRRWKKRKTWR